MKKIDNYVGRSSDTKSEDTATNQDRINGLKHELLAPYKNIREAVHGDIKVTHLETEILDSRTFQRLHGLRQLGPSYLVYPSANHTRFEHALGTLFMAQKMIEYVNSNRYRDLELQTSDQFLIRLCSLLHDVCNLPFGHTLEEEGMLFKRQWEDTKRVDYFLGEQSEIGQKILNNEILNELSAFGEKEFEPKHVLNEIKNILISLERKTVESLEKPYIADIVGNTLCADLLDYVKRDPWFAGLHETYDERFLYYLYITKYEGKPRLILRLIKPGIKEVRRDVLSELLHLLRLRYSLAEKVYYHHAKMSASAMIISAANAMIQDGDLSDTDLYSMDDNSLLRLLEEKGNEVSKNLINSLLKRNLVDVVYDVTYSEKGFGRAEPQRKEEIIRMLRNPKKRFEIERRIESTFGLQPGSVVVYCPGEEMGQKAVKALVDTGDYIGPLDKIADDRIRWEIETSIVRKHLELWKMCVLVGPSITEAVRCNVNKFCEEQFGQPSASERYKLSSAIVYLMPYAERWAMENSSEPPIDTNEIRQIEQIRTRDKKEWLSYADFCDIIRTVRKRR